MRLSLNNNLVLINIKKGAYLLGGLFLLVACNKSVEPIKTVKIDATKLVGFRMFNAHFFVKNNQESLIGLNLEGDKLVRLSAEEGIKELTQFSSLEEELGFSPYLMGTNLVDSTVYISTYTDNLILQYEIERNALSSLYLPLDSAFGIYSWCSSSNILKHGQDLVLPIRLNVNHYESDPEELNAKFSAPQAAIFDLTTSTIKGYLGSFPSILKERYYIDDFHYQTNFKQGFVMSDFLTDTIRVYNDSYSLVNLIPAKSKYASNISPTNDSILNNDDLYSKYIMESFRYSQMQYDSISGLLIRICYLSDNYIQDGLLKPILQKSFSIQFIKDGELVAEQKFDDGKYRGDSIYLVDGKLILFCYNEGSYTNLEYHVFNPYDFM